jgi:hypothetical protein
MVLLNTMIRSAAITGNTDSFNAWFAGRQGGRWAMQTVRAAVPTAAPQAQGTPPAGATAPPADPADTLRELTELHQQGILTDAEFQRLRSRVRA